MPGLLKLVVDGHLNHLRTHRQSRGWWGVELLRRKKVDRKLGGEPSGQGTGVGRGKQQTRGKGYKNWGKQGAWEWGNGE